VQGGLPVRKKNTKIGFKTESQIKNRHLVVFSQCFPAQRDKK